MDYNDGAHFLGEKTQIIGGLCVQSQPETWQYKKNIIPLELILAKVPDIFDSMNVWKKWSAEYILKVIYGQSANTAVSAMRLWRCSNCCML